MFMGVGCSDGTVKIINTRLNVWIS
jgi:hypothetical protein